MAAMKRLVLLLALLALVALRRREPDRATATHWHEHDDGMSGVQTDPYPWQVLEA